MNWPLWNFILQIGGLLVLPIGYFLWANVQSIRQNDLKHLEENHAAVLSALARIEQKVDAHLRWHAERL